MFISAGLLSTIRRQLSGAEDSLYRLNRRCESLEKDVEKLNKDKMGRDFVDMLKYSKTYQPREPMTVEQILEEAFERIQSEHRIAIDDVSYSTVEASSAADHKFVVTSIDFHGTALRK